MKYNYIKNKKKIKDENGFSLVDAIVSMSLLAGVITYGIYFSSIRLSTVYDSNIIRSINKEIDRDIERLKSEFWVMYFDKIQGKYLLSQTDCMDFSDEISKLQSWNIDENSPNRLIQSWRPSEDRSKVFKGQSVLITRELRVESAYNLLTRDQDSDSPYNQQYLDKSVADITYSVQYGEKNIHWVSISMGPEAHSWCDQEI